MYEFEKLKEAQRVFAWLMKFYNQERINGGITKMSPNRFIFRLGAEQYLKLFTDPVADVEQYVNLKVNL
jgi:hypothetical protein